MKNNLLSKILGVGLAIGLVFSLGAAIIPADEARADEMEWGQVSTPSWEDNVIAPGTDIFDYAVGPDGETIYATGAITSLDVEHPESDGSIHGLSGGFTILDGEATVTRISDEVAEIEGWLEGDACYLNGDFTLFLIYDFVASMTGTITGDPDPGDDDDLMEFSGKLYDEGGMFDDSYSFGIDQGGSLCVNDWTTELCVAGDIE